MKCCLDFADGSHLVHVPELCVPSVGTAPCAVVVSGGVSITEYLWKMPTISRKKTVCPFLSTWPRGHIVSWGLKTVLVSVKDTLWNLGFGKVGIRSWEFPCLLLEMAQEPSQLKRGGLLFSLLTFLIIIWYFLFPRRSCLGPRTG